MLTSFKTFENPKKEEKGSRPCGKQCKLCKHIRKVDRVRDKDGKENEGDQEKLGKEEANKN